jgi:hypothetical protein
MESEFGLCVAEPFAVGVRSAKESCVDEHAAQDEARRRNLELGGKRASDAYYVEVERDGDWAVERRRDPPERRSWPSRIVDAIFDMSWP